MTAFLQIPSWKTSGKFHFSFTTRSLTSLCPCKKVINKTRQSIFISKPNPCNSRTRTLNDSGRPGSGKLSPFTMDS